MSKQDIAAFVIAWGALLIIVGRKRIRDVLNDLRAPERSTPERSCRCSGTGTVLVDGPCDAAPAEVPCSCQSAPSARVRLRSGAAWCEAMACQLDELRNLPEADPSRRRRLA